MTVPVLAVTVIVEVTGAGARDSDEDFPMIGAVTLCLSSSYHEKSGSFFDFQESVSPAKVPIS